MEFRFKYPEEDWITSKHKLYDGDIVVFEKNGEEIEARYCLLEEDAIFDDYEIMIQRPGVEYLELINLTKTVTFRKTNKVENNTCTHSKKYINFISKNLKFWVCPTCKKDLGTA
jgi:hypothetical protein